MDGFTLRCNNLRCRAQLELRAAVTTCSHIFCISCASSLQLTNAENGRRICPACDTTLSAPDDAVITLLNPSDDYKTSVLSGLSPSVIMEICSKGLGFWTYQVTQEVVYQEYLAKSLTERSTSLSGQLDKIIRDANSEIGNLRDKMAAMSLTEEELRRKNHELMEGWREKGRKLAQTQELYDKLKRRTLISQVRSAASENITHTLLMSAQKNASSHNPPHLQDIPAAQQGQDYMSLHDRRRHRDVEPDFVMTGARIGNINGARNRSNDGSSGRGSPFTVSNSSLGVSGLASAIPPQRYRAAARRGGGFHDVGENTFSNTPARSQEHRQRLLPTPAINTSLRTSRYPGADLITETPVGQNRNPLDEMNGNIDTGRIRRGANEGFAGKANLRVRGEY